MAISNVKMEVKGKSTLILTVDLNTPGSPSKSGKTNLVSTTGGFIEIPGVDGVKVSLNVTRK